MNITWKFKLKNFFIELFLKFMNNWIHLIYVALFFGIVDKKFIN